MGDEEYALAGKTPDEATKARIGREAAVVRMKDILSGKAGTDIPRDKDKDAGAKKDAGGTAAATASAAPAAAPTATGTAPKP